MPMATINPATDAVQSFVPHDAGEVERRISQSRRGRAALRQLRAAGGIDERRAGVIDPDIIHRTGCRSIVPKEFHDQAIWPL